MTSILTLEEYFMKIIGTIRQIVEVWSRYVLLLAFLLVLYCCKAHKSCVDEGDMKLLQAYESAGMSFKLYKQDQGAFGGTAKLRVCNIKKNILVEEIVMRGDDHLPALDSVVGRTIYLHYSFPRKSSVAKIEDLDFDSVVLGEALLGEVKSKYNYIFKNIPKK